jgi:glycosyltransferase involved in cell wall biosynthesis
VRVSRHGHDESKPKFMITVSHPQVNQYVRALLTALDEKGELCEFHTTLSVGRRRVGIPGVRQKVRHHPYREIARLFAQRFGQEWLIRHGSGLASSDAVAWEFDRQVAKCLTSCSTIYCYEDSALETFRAAERIGARRFYELPIMYWETVQKLLREEAERYPKWEPTLQATRDSARKLERKEKELRLANLVICPSRQVKESLPDGTLSLVAEYGCPPLATKEPVRNSARLRILFVGTMTQRKGLADLFTAMKRLRRSDVELLVLGTPLLPLPFYRKEYSSFVYEATRPTRKVQELMLTCDVLVLPSIVEGRAMVQMEALSCGLPIVVTPNAGAEDLIEPGRTGFLIPIRAPEAIAERIDWIADHRDWVDDMRPAIMEKARQSDWRRYSEKVLSIVL